MQDRREKVKRLQQESGEAEEASKASARDGHGLVGTTGDGRWGGGADGAAASASWVDRGDGVSGPWGGAVGVDRGGGCGSAGGAGHGAGGVDWLADGARAVGDGQRGSLGDSVGLAVVGELGGLWAVGCVRGDDLSGVAHVAVAIGGRGGGSQGEDGSSLELHLDGRMELLEYYFTSVSGAKAWEFWRGMDAERARRMLG